MKLKQQRVCCYCTRTLNTNTSLIAKLRRRGHHLILSSDLRAAVAILSEQPIDLVLMFISSERQGLVWLDQLRQQTASAALPIIALVETADTINAALRAGADDVLVAPFHAALVERRIQSLVALRQARTETVGLHQLNVNLSRMFWHDLRNPLGNIRMAQYMLRELLLEDEQVAATLTTVDASLDSLLETVNKFVAALQAHSLDPQMDCLNVSDLVRSVISAFHASATHKQITLVQAGESCLTLADHTLLGQALGNLLSNALKFSPPDSTVRVVIEFDGAQVRVVVEDQGPGIPEGERARLFQMFAKLTPRPTANENSSGLGLWIVSQAMRAQAGSYGAEFPPEGGSRFWIALPRDC